MFGPAIYAHHRNEMKQALTPALFHMRAQPATYWSRRHAHIAVDEIVLHDTSSGAPFERSLRYLANPGDGREVSIHYLIGREHGQLYAMVPEDRTAHHANAHNFRSVGIELYKLASDTGDFTDWQYNAVSQLVFDIRWRQNIRRDRVVSHAEIDPDNRNDPRGFDWARFNRLVDQIDQQARSLNPAYGTRY